MDVPVQVHCLNSWVSQPREHVVVMFDQNNTKVYQTITKQSLVWDTFRPEPYMQNILGIYLMSRITLGLSTSIYVLIPFCYRQASRILGYNQLTVDSLYQHYN